MNARARIRTLLAIAVLAILGMAATSRAQPEAAGLAAPHIAPPAAATGAEGSHGRLLALAAGETAASTSLPPAAIGTPAPNFSLPTAAAEVIALEQLRGRVVYVDFWASWCAPCRRSFPWMNAMHARHGERGLTIVAINVDKQRADAERFLREIPARFVVVYDPVGRTPAAYGVKGMPSAFLIDRQGIIVAIETGFRDDRKVVLEQRIEALLRTH